MIRGKLKSGEEIELSVRDEEDDIVLVIGSLAEIRLDFDEADFFAQMLYEMANAPTDEELN
jgi:hypothetical protein